MMNKLRKYSGILALLAVIPFFAGCATTPLSPQTIQSDITNASEVVGGLAKEFLPAAGSGGVIAGEVITALCMLKTSGDATDPSVLANDIKTALGQLWTYFNSLNTAEANEIVLAINTAWSLLNTAITNAVPTSPQALAYLLAFIDGFCTGFTGM